MVRYRCVEVILGGSDESDLYFMFQLLSFCFACYLALNVDVMSFVESSSFSDDLG